MAQDQITRELFNAQLPLIRAATGALKQDGVQRYAALRLLLGDDRGPARKSFETKFASFYGMNAGGISPRFRRVYFDRLYSLRDKKKGRPPYESLLRELYEIPRRQGDKVLPCSFVSKLVAIHDETRPLFDKYVSRFFGIAAPKSTSIELRIAGFLANLELVRSYYYGWSQDERFQSIFEEVSCRIPELRHFDPVRICDFLVWQVGRIDGEVVREPALLAKRAKPR